MIAKLKRREFITLVGGAAAWPLAARAQQAAMPVIGLLDAASAAERTEYVAAFRRGLATGGDVGGRNERPQKRRAGGPNTRLPGRGAGLSLRAERRRSAPSAPA